MARYIGPREKIERRIGTKLFLKGERSYSPKSATVKRMYPPGMHGKTFSGRLSEFGSQLRSKQKIKNIYRMMEKQFKKWAKNAINIKAETSNVFVRRLERRLDNIVYRAGLAQSRDQARQAVNHGHIVVNGKKVTIPSYEVKQGDVVGVRENSKKNKYFSTLVLQWLPKHKPPKWIELNPENLTAKISGMPTFEESGLDYKDIQAIIEYYSR